jgi:hypothetical protein
MTAHLVKYKGTRENPHHQNVRLHAFEEFIRIAESYIGLAHRQVSGRPIPSTRALDLYAEVVAMAEAQADAEGGG